MEKPTKEEMNSPVVKRARSKFAELKAREEGRLSAFKEMMDWAKKEMGLLKEELANDCGNIDFEERADILVKIRLYREVFEFAEAQIKKVGK